MSSRATCTSTRGTSGSMISLLLRALGHGLSWLLGMLDWPAVAGIFLDRSFTESSHDEDRMREAIGALLDVPAAVRDGGIAPFDNFDLGVTTPSFDLHLLWETRHETVYRLTGVSPVAKLLPEGCCQQIHAQLVMPKLSFGGGRQAESAVDAADSERHWRDVKERLPKLAGLAILMPATADIFMWSRRWLYALPLARGSGRHERVASLILEAPYYGRRRPHGYPGSPLVRMSVKSLDDLFTQVAATVVEAVTLAAVFQGHAGARGVVFAGFSLGGTSAAMASLRFPRNSAVVSLAGCADLRRVYTAENTVLATLAVDWRAVERSLMSRGSSSAAKTPRAQCRLDFQSLLQQLNASIMLPVFNDNSSEAADAQRACIFLWSPHDQIVPTASSLELLGVLRASKGSRIVEEVNPEELPGGHATISHLWSGVYTAAIRRALGLSKQLSPAARNGT